MDQKQIAKQMIELGQTTFNNAFNAGILLQDQYERITNTVLDQATWLPPEGRKAIERLAESYKSNRDNFKKYVDDGYRQANQFFSG